MTGEIICGDCLEAMLNMPSDSVDLIVTSPPYADRRKKQYGGLPADKYADWFMPRAAEMQRILKPRGSFVCNTKEHVVDGERSTYVIDMVLRMRANGWRWVEEYVWHKKNCHPGKWPGRFRDAWERCFHFTTQRQFTMYQNAVMVPTGDWAKKRLANLAAVDTVRYEASTKSNFGRNVSHWVGRNMAYPSNVIHTATQTTNVGHPAAFPELLPDFFIRLFTKPGDTVLDPFCGSGTTCAVAARLGRKFIGMEISRKYCDIARDRVDACQVMPGVVK